MCVCVNPSICQAKFPIAAALGSQADFIYAPIYMSCYNLHAAAESNQKAWMALEGFMSRLLSQSGPILDTILVLERLCAGSQFGIPA